MLEGASDQPKLNVFSIIISLFLYFPCILLITSNNELLTCAVVECVCLLYVPSLV